jgi:hypothetical protein
MAVAAKWSLIPMVALAAAICCKPDSCPPNYSPGDKFRITVNALSAGIPCPGMQLSPGDSFVVTASNRAFGGPVGDSCYVYGAEPEVPEFAKGVISSCVSDGRLGISCEGVTASGCQVTMKSWVGSVPSSSQGVIDHDVYKIDVFLSTRSDGGVCAGYAACTAVDYDVRIERLAAGADY